MVVPSRTSPSAGGSPTSVVGALWTLPRQLFVLAGQSNMAGRDQVFAVAAPDALPLLQSRPVVSFAQRAEKWQRARHPLHADKPEKAGVGPGLACAHHLLEEHDATTAGGVGLVPCAFGGSELSRWEAGGDLFEECVRRVKLAQSDASEPTRLAGILWHQGENDCGEAASAATYAERLPRALDALRAALGAPDLPIVVGELGYWLDQADPDYVHAAAINAAIVSAPRALAHCACVSSHGLRHKGDRLHFDAASSEELGRRYATAWLSIDTDAQDVSPVPSKRPRLQDVAPPQAGAPDCEAPSDSAAPFSFPTSASEASEVCGGLQATEAAIRD